MYVHTIVVLDVTAGQVAVPPLFKASDDVPVEVTASEKLIVTGIVSPIFLVPEPVVVNELIVGAVVSAIETVVPASVLDRMTPLKPSLKSSTDGVTEPLAPWLPVARRTIVARSYVPAPAAVVL